MNSCCLLSLCWCYLCSSECCDLFQCQEHLIRREILIARDYKVSTGLAKVCKDAIRASHCRHYVSEDKDIRLAQILLCLEGVIRNGRLLLHI